MKKHINMTTGIFLLILINLVSTATPTATKGDDVPSRPRRHLEGVACIGNDECSESQYCASGKCLDFSFCNVVADCYNPANKFDTVACVGPVSCDSEGTCSKDCSLALDEVSCYTPICDDDTEATGCDEATVCIQDRCANGDPIFMDVAGNVVCTDDGSEGDSPAPSTVCKMSYLLMTVTALAVYFRQ